MLMYAATNSDSETRRVSRMARLLRTEQGADEAGLGGSNCAIRCGECALLQRRQRGYSVPPPREDAFPGAAIAQQNAITRSVGR